MTSQGGKFSSSQTLDIPRNGEGISLHRSFLRQPTGNAGERRRNFRREDPRSPRRCTPTPPPSRRGGMGKPALVPRVAENGAVLLSPLFAGRGRVRGLGDWPLGLRLSQRQMITMVCSERPGSFSSAATHPRPSPDLSPQRGGERGSPQLSTTRRTNNDMSAELSITRQGDVIVIAPAWPSMKDLVADLRAMPKPSSIEVREPIELPDRESNWQRISWAWRSHARKLGGCNITVAEGCDRPLFGLANLLGARL